MAYIESTTNAAGSTTTLVVDPFIAMLPVMNVIELAATFRMLRRQFDSLQATADGLSLRGEGYDFLDPLQEENDWRLKAVMDELRARRAEGAEEVRAARCAMLEYVALCGGEEAVLHG